MKALPTQFENLSF